MYTELIDKIYELKLPACYIDHMRGIVELATKAPPGCIVETGVARGGTAAILTAIGNDAHRKVYLCDSYDGFPKPDEIDLNSGILEGAGKGYITTDLVMNNLQKCGLSIDNVVFVKGFFEETMPTLKDTIEPISFIHFDGDFYKSAIDVIDNLWEKIVPNGIIVFHDYPVYDGMKKALEERFSIDKIKMLTPGSAYVIKE